MYINDDTALLDLLNARIISVRSFNGLHSIKMECIGDVREYIEAGNSLLNIRNLGRKSQYEIDKLLARIPKSTKIDAAETKTNKKTVVLAFEKAYNEVSVENENVDAYIQGTYENAWDLHEQIFQNTDAIMNVRGELSSEENISFRKYHIDILRTYLTNLQEENNVHFGNIKNIVMPIIERLEQNYEKFSLYDISVNFLSQQHRKCIEQKYEQMCAKKLNIRAQNFIKTYIKSFDDLVRLFDQPLSAYSTLCPGQHKKTLQDIYTFNQSFKSVFLSLYSMDSASLQDSIVKNKYPFLSKKQRDFVEEFDKRNGYTPLFYLLYNYLRISDAKSDMLYSKYHGIFDNSCYTLEELASETHLSRERVRQLVSGTISAVESIGMTDEDMCHYNQFCKLSYIKEDTDELKELKEKEHINCSFHAIGSIIQLILPFQFFRINKGISILISNDLQSTINMKTLVERIFSFVNAKYSQTTTIDLETIIGITSLKFKKTLTEITCDILRNIYHINASSEGKVTFAQNCIDIENELYLILCDNGEPMHIEDLYNKFKKKYPNHKFTNSSQIRSYLLKSDRIGSIGKTSTYALMSWEEIYFGNIRDFLIDTLKQSEAPLHIDVLMDKISTVYPTTNQNSIESTMQSDTSDRFVIFEGGFYGLSNRQYDEKYIIKNSIRKISFEERIQGYKNFVEMYHRFPSAVGGENETSLQRWYYNIMHEVISLTPSQRKNFDDMLLTYKDSGYPRNQTENEFKNNCIEIKRFIREKHKLPSCEEGRELYLWLHRTKGKYNGYSDQRYDYFLDLINFLNSYGFII